MKPSSNPSSSSSDLFFAIIFLSGGDFEDIFPSTVPLLSFISPAQDANLPNSSFISPTMGTPSPLPSSLTSTNVLTPLTAFINFPALRFHDLSTMAAAATPPVASRANLSSNPMTVLATLAMSPGRRSAMAPASFPSTFLDPELITRRKFRTPLAAALSSAHVLTSAFLFSTLSTAGPYGISNAAPRSVAARTSRARRRKGSWTPPLPAA
mmetsp:Transcript_4483/g.9471  ORF Transcript_4483/g.9471 Transcript_4483/m.9471 type:complete len:210 (+) Transcript_4483:498-1127(+)